MIKKSFNEHNAILEVKTTVSVWSWECSPASLPAQACVVKREFKKAEQLIKHAVYLAR